MLNYKELLFRYLDIERLKKIKQINTSTLTIELYDGTTYQESTEDILLLIECFKYANLDLSVIV